MHRLTFLAALLLAPGFTFALEPEGVFLITNKNVAASRTLAEHYCKAREVPVENIIELDLPTGEDIGRRDYDEKMVKPLRERLAKDKDKLKVLLSIHGVPLRVGRSEASEDDRKELAKLQEKLGPLTKERQELDAQIKTVEEGLKKEKDAEKEKQLGELRKNRNDLGNRMRPLEQARRWLTHQESQSCVDSELSLLWHEKYELRRWVINPLYFQLPEEVRKNGPAVVMTARLDGPTPELVRGIIDQSIAVEKKGLQGKVYVDARGIGFNAKADSAGTGYGGYDESLREMAKLLEQAKFNVVLDNKGPLFAPGSCPDCALYCGWYSLANFVDCCTFVPGAVAYHIASSEAVSLRRPGAKYWCKNLLEKGAVVTLGPVAEPYTIGFPKPAEFFGMLATGEYTVVECYWRTALLTSWMTVLVADPLYNPYKHTPMLKGDDVKPSPAGATLRFGRRGE